MVIAVLSAIDLMVKTGPGSHIHLTAKNGIDACSLSRPVKINHTKHDTVIGDRSTVHPQLFYPGNVLFDFI